jgi:hypothetical protein
MIKKSVENEDVNQRIVVVRKSSNFSKEFKHFILVCWFINPSIKQRLSLCDSLRM